MVKHVDVAVYTVAQEVKAGKTPSGSVELGLKDNGVGLTDFKYTLATIGPARVARLAALRAAIVAGKIAPPQTREQLAAFAPVKL
jgi:basic membrane protein A